MKKAGLYLHVPFCAAKCGYCAFNSIAADQGTADDYLDCLTKEIATYAKLDWAKEQRFTTLFIGGGTPTLASAAKLAAIISLCRERFQWEDGPEISMEANPDSITSEGLSILQQAGVNRLSIGVQSFNDTILAALNRPHSGRQAVQAFETARACGFSNINLDLIYGLPGQSLQNWQDDIDQAIGLSPEHLALYELTVEPGTPFAAKQNNNQLRLPSEDMVADMEELTARLLAPAYQRYEISNFAKPGYQCRHNINYWHNGSYLGLGAGAVSCLDGLRLSHQPEPRRFMDLVNQDKSTISQVECLSRRGRFRESMIMGLRLIEGIDLAAFEQRYQLSSQAVYGSLLNDLAHQKMLVRSGTCLRLASKYLSLANQILTKLV